MAKAPNGTRTPRQTIRRSLTMAVASLILVILGAGPAAATWSVVGVDPDSGEVGAAIASCVPAYALGDLEKPLSLLALAPGKGVGVSQALVNDDVPPVMLQMLIDSSSAADVIAAVSSEDFDSDRAVRQHGVATLNGGSASYTGEETDEVSGDLQAQNVAAQGNTLVSEEVATNALAGFQDPAHPDLAARLVAALQAGSDAGGDSRCGAQTALFAEVVVVALADDPSEPTVMLLTTVDKGSGLNPVDLLTAEFEKGQRQNSILLATDTSPLVWILLIVGVVAMLAATAIGVVIWKFVRRSRRTS
ncbi:MAG: DUF1028 domain-containing protein [Acidimicrobiales bacterium]